MSMIVAGIDHEHSNLKWVREEVYKPGVELKFNLVCMTCGYVATSFATATDFDQAQRDLLDDYIFACNEDLHPETDLIRIFRDSHHANFVLRALQNLYERKIVVQFSIYAYDTHLFKPRSTDGTIASSRYQSIFPSLGYPAQFQIRVALTRLGFEVLSAIMDANKPGKEAGWQPNSPITNDTLSTSSPMRLAQARTLLSGKNPTK